MDRQQIEQLHQKASDRYLSGDFREALVAWEQLLQIDPTDAKAQEGVRLCRLMAGEEESLAAPAAAPSSPNGLGATPGPNGGTRGDPAEAEPQDLGIELDLGAIEAPEPRTPGSGPTATAPSPAESPLIPDLDDETLDQKLSFLDATLDAPAGVPPQAGPVERPDASRQGEGLDLGDTLSAEPIALTPGAAPLPDGGAPRAPGPFQSGAPPLDEAAAELQHRVEALMNEARSLAADGRNEEALSLIERVLILDEMNEEASKLQLELKSAGSPNLAEQVEGWMNEAAQEFGNGNLDKARETLNRVLEEWPGHNEARFLMERVEAAAAGPQEVPVMGPQDLPAPPAPEQDLPLDETVPLAPLGTEVAPAVSGTPDASWDAAPAGVEVATQPPRRSSGFPKFILLIVPLFLIGVAAWWYLPQFLGTGGAPEPGGVNTAGSERPSSVAPERPAVTPEEPSGSTPEPVAPFLEETLRQSIERARELFREGDYASAVVAYNQVLEIDPRNVEARDGLLEAGELYKAQKEVEQQLERIRESFDSGAYANALRLLYRLPESVDQAMVRGYLVDGWHNLGVQELQSGDPREAIQHFDEALAINPGDEEVKKLRALASGFLERPKDATYYQVMEALPLREMD